MHSERERDAVEQERWLNTRKRESRTQVGVCVLLRERERQTAEYGRERERAETAHSRP